MAFQPGAFQAGAFQGAEGEPVGVINAVEQGTDSASAALVVRIVGTGVAEEAGADSAAVLVAVTISAVIVATETGSDTASVAGDSEGTIIIIPRDATNGIAYLVEVEAFDTIADQIVTLRYSSDGFNTLPSDDPPNQFYAPRLVVPGDYSRSMFGSGGTSGDIQVGAGAIQLNNLDGGLDRSASTDRIDHMAFDGYRVAIKTVDRLRPLYADAVTVFRGTMSQAQFTWGEVELLIRDRLVSLDKPIQEDLFAGTTTEGGLGEAEGQPDDLKGRPKPLPYGAPRQIEAVTANSFDNIYAVGADGLDAITEVRDSGVLITDSGDDYADVTSLATADVAEGFFATSLDAGLFRLGSEAVGLVTAAPVLGPTGADRTAAQLSRRILERMGLAAGADFRLDDIDALDALNGAEIGYWIGAEERTALQAISDILGSIGATCMPDRLGVFRLYRLDEPGGVPVTTITAAELIEPSGAGIERLRTGDQGRGLEAWRVGIRYGWNGAVMNRSEIDPEAVYTSPAFAAFATQEWRTVTAEDETVRLAHRLSPELTFDTFLVDEAAAQAEAERRLALYSVRRDRYLVPIKAFLAEQIDLNAVIRLRINRFGLAAGKLFRVIGMTENFDTGITTLDVWG